MNNPMSDERPAAGRGSAGREAVAFAIHLAAVGGFIWIMVALGRRSWNDFAYLLREDGAFETVTAAFLFLSCAVSHQLACVARREGGRKAAVALWLGAAMFLFAGMEEISWGQRILGLKTPDALSAINEQRELNLHNVKGLHGGTEVKVFLVLGAYGALSGLAAAWASSRGARWPRLASWCESLRWFVVPVRFAPYFLQMWIYTILRRNDARMLQVFPEKRLIKELLEFLFALGCYLAIAWRLRVEWSRGSKPLPSRTDAGGTSA
jgi:hypothetical protein